MLSCVVLNEAHCFHEIGVPGNKYGDIIDIPNRLGNEVNGNVGIHSLLHVGREATFLATVFAAILDPSLPQLSIPTFQKGNPREAPEERLLSLRCW